MRATLKDIAEATGLSVSSVSLVLNNRPHRISHESCQKILKAARELDYHPNQAAVSLITKRSKSIGLVIPDITNMFFAQIAKGAETRSAELGYSLVLCNTNDNPGKDVDYINVLLDRGVDGILLVSAYRPGGAATKRLPGELRLMEKPVVLVDRNVEHLSAKEHFSGVFSDNELGGYLATRHLISLGHTKIGCITGPMGAVSSKNRLFGHIRALQEAGITFDGALVREGNYHINSGFEFGNQLLDQGVTAIFACNDMMAYGVYRAAAGRGVAIPKELSVVGFDDLPFSEIAEPSLTSVKQSSYEMGVRAVDKIIKMITKPEEIGDISTLKPELVIRKSTGRISGEEEIK